MTSRSESLGVMRLVLDVDPASLPTAQQKGVTRRGRVYTKSAVRLAKEQLVSLLILDFMRSGRGFPAGEVFYRAWSCSLEFVYALSSTRRADYGLPKATRPDVDNLAKLVLDAMTASGRFWRDDGQVARLEVKKRHAREGERACVVVAVGPLPRRPFRKSEQREE